MPRNAATNRLVQRNYNAALAGNNCRTTTVGLNINTSGASCAFWYYPIAADGNVAASFEDSANSSVFRVNIESATRKLFTWTTSGGVGRAHKPTYTISLNEWHYIVFTYANVDGANRRSTIYVDGVSIGTETSAGLADTSSRFSCSAGSTSRLVSDVRVFNYELSSDDVLKLYYENINPDIPVLNWLLTEGAGSSASDSSGNGWTGTITSAAWTGNTPMKARKLINGNMVKNGDFEYAPPFTAATTTASRYIDGSAGGSTTNDLFGWAIESNGSAGTFSAQYDSSSPYAGSYSMKISTLAIASAISVRSIRNSSTTADILRNGIPVTPNTTYNVSFVMRTNLVSGSATSGAFLRINHFNSAGSSVTSTDSTKVQTTTGQTVYTFQLTTGTATTLLIPNMQVVGNDGAATLIMDAYFDAISITPVYPEGRVPANGNLVKNFDFEVAPTFVAAQTTGVRWIDGTAAGSASNATYKWAIPSGGIAASANVMFDSTVVFSGSYSIKLSLLNTSGALTVAQTLNTSTPSASDFIYPVLPSTSYTLTARVRTNNSATNSAFVDARQFSNGLTTITTTSTNKLSGTNDWTLVTATFTTNAAAAYVGILLRHNVPGNVSEAWFDDIYLAPTTNPGRVVIT